MTSLPRSMCPACGLLMPLPNNPGLPAPGDMTVCSGCATMLTFDAGLRLALPPVGLMDRIMKVDPILGAKLRLLADAVVAHNIQHGQPVQEVGHA